MTQTILPSFSIPASARTSQIFGHQFKLMEMEQTHLQISSQSMSSPELKLKASASPPGLTQEITNNKQNSATESSSVHFSEMKQRFLRFKRDKYLENSSHYANLANNQAPKFMVIACGDSRVCPSSILGFQPGEAFVVRNIANLVPSYENGPTETNAALEFAVNSLKVENIFVIGHSRCGGIRALISMQDDDNSSFIKNWVVVSKPARLRTKDAASDLSLDQQCRLCEKESINDSLQRLLSYPWIQDKVRSGALAIHGGYYDFTDCTFEKWTLEYDSSSSAVDGGYCLKNREFWC